MGIKFSVNGALSTYDDSLATRQQTQIDAALFPVKTPKIGHTGRFIFHEFQDDDITINPDTANSTKTWMDDPLGVFDRRIMRVYNNSATITQITYALRFAVTGLNTKQSRAAHRVVSITNGKAIDHIRIYLSTVSDFSTYIRASLNTSVTAGYQYTRILPTDWVTFGGQTTADSFTYIRFQTQVQSGGASTIDFAGILLALASITGGVPVVLAHDDGPDTWLNHGLPLCTRYNVPTTQYVVASEGFGATGSYCRLVENAGHLVAVHTYGHVHLDTLSYADQVYQLETMGNLLKSYGLKRKGWEHVAYPFGGYNADTLLALTNLGCKSGRIVAGGSTLSETFNYLANFPDIDSRQLFRGYHISGSMLASDVLTLLDTRAGYGVCSCLLVHGLYDTPTDGQWTISEYEALLSGLHTRELAGTIQLVCMDELIDALDYNEQYGVIAAG